MATFTIYTAKPNPAGPGLTQTPVASGITFNDAITQPFSTVGKFLELIQREDHRGLTYLASSDAGVTFVRASDVGGQ